MSIRFVRNDSIRQFRLQSTLSPAAQPTGRRVSFTYVDEAPEAVYPADDDRRFVFWQCRESAIRTLEAWESISSRLRLWQSGNRQLEISHNHGLGLEALYDRRRLSFYRWESSDPHTYTAASVDAVAHEVGHAILDALRPDLWNSLYPEVVAFHEGFADCIALVTGLFDRLQREALIARAPTPRQALAPATFTGAIAESVAEAFAGSYPANDPATIARQCNNELKWSIPTTLPPTAPGAALSMEPHSFGRIFAGCFYDVIRNIYEGGDAHTPDGLLTATRAAGQLLANAIKVAPEVRRFFQAVGRAMILLDEGSADGGRHHLAVRDAFSRHDVALGSAAMLAPTVSLEGPAPTVGVRGASSRALSPKTRRELCRNVNTPHHTRISLKPTHFGKRLISEASYRREVALENLDKQLTGVIAKVNEVVLLGKTRNQCMVLDQLPSAAATEREVVALVETLLNLDCLLLQGRAKTKRRMKDKTKASRYNSPTHSVRKQGKNQVIRRLRFACGAPRESFVCEFQQNEPVP